MNPTTQPVEMVTPPPYPRLYAHSEEELARQWEAWKATQTK